MNNHEILAALNKEVFGHEKTKKTLITALNRTWKLYYKKFLLNEETDLKPNHIMLIGDSGTGKTHLVNTLAKTMKLPILKLDATKLGPSGNNDSISPKELQKLIQEKVKYYMEKDELEYRSFLGTRSRLIIFIDEIDKLAKAFESSGNWNKQIVASLLTLMEMDITFIFAGAFMDMKKTHKSNAIGFFADITKKAKESTEPFSDVDLIDYGFAEEFIGRISYISSLDKFTKEDYKMLAEKQLRKANENLTEMGTNILELNDAELNEIVEETLKSKQGVRYIDKMLMDKSLNLEFEANDWPGMKM